MILITEEQDCCGCGACNVICPKHCIRMREGSLGCLFPEIINLNECINCGLCEKVCPMLCKLKLQKFKQYAFAAYAKNAKTRFDGSSGGIFGVFAHLVLSKGYLVYGAAFDEKHKLKCTMAKDETGLAKLYKSKYLQSELSGKLLDIQEKLEQGKKILFVSTPCQVVSLKNFLGREYNNLITIDFFCHGVPSQSFFDKCLKIDQERFGGEIKKYQFRSKKHISGVTPHYFTIEISSKRKEKKIIMDLYYKSSFYALFQKYITLRESCYNCKFAGFKRLSDITIGDFHEIDNYVQGINRFEGVSKVIINSEKGELLWRASQKDIFFKPVDLNKLIADGICFCKGTERPISRDKFIEDYNKMDFEKLINKWANRKQYWKQKIYYSLPSIIREQLRKRLGD